MFVLKMGSREKIQSLTRNLELISFTRLNSDFADPKGSFPWIQGWKTSKKKNMKMSANCEFLKHNCSESLILLLI